MDLFEYEKYLHENGETLYSFSKRCQLTAMTLHNVIVGSHKPSSRTLTLLEKYTEGKVTRDDCLEYYRLKQEEKGDTIHHP